MLLNDSRIALSYQSDLLHGVFSPGKTIFKFKSTPSKNRLSLEDGFRMLVSSNPLLRIWLIVSHDLANLVKSSSGDLAILTKSSSGMWPFLVSHLLH